MESPCIANVFDLSTFSAPSGRDKRETSEPIATQLSISSLANVIRQWVPMGGTLHQGYQKATASVTDGDSQSIEVSVSFVTMSVSSRSFDSFRSLVKATLGSVVESRIANLAGIVTTPPPAPSSRMAYYTQYLYSEILFNGDQISDQNRKFGPRDLLSSNSAAILALTRLLEVSKVTLTGKLSVSSTPPFPSYLEAFVPITAIQFDDGLTIPFAGYSNNLVIKSSEVRSLEIPSVFWHEMTAQ